MENHEKINLMQAIQADTLLSAYHKEDKISCIQLKDGIIILELSNQISLDCLQWIYNTLYELFTNNSIYNVQINFNFSQITIS